MEKIRSFIAVDIESEEFRSQILELQKKIIDIGADIKPIVPENIHLTLRFLGEIETTLMEKIVDMMKLIEFQPFEIQFKGTGAFPSMKKINVIWVGLTLGQEELSRISRSLESQFRKLGISEDKKGFSPHVTIARIRSGRNRDAIADLLYKSKEKTYGSMIAEAIRFKKSVLTPQGPIYSTIFEVKS
ncbi:MAG: RNA 2',3'-cyclic phosphodiesterase [Candidatus Bathyarchaeia archaeon]